MWPTIQVCVLNWIFIAREYAFFVSYALLCDCAPQKMVIIVVIVLVVLALIALIIGLSVGLTVKRNT